jgi:hypothetical protein
MRAVDRKGWMIFGGTVALVIVFGVGVSGVMSPLAGVTYCTAGFETCVTHGRSSPWHVLEKPCPVGQSLRFTRPAVFVGVSRCHSIAVPDFSSRLEVCPAACAK